MKKVFDKMRSFYKKLIKKLNNFRLTSLIIAIVSLFAGGMSLGLMFIYYFAGNVSETTQARMPSFFSLDVQGETITGTSGRIMGMIFFLTLIIVLILSCVIIYGLFPAIRNKDKVLPKKSPLILAIINGAFEVVVLVFSILAIVLEKPNTFAGYCAAIPVIALTAIANILCIVPFLKCVFYQPAVGSKFIERKPKEEAPKEAAESK